MAYMGSIVELIPLYTIPPTYKVKQKENSNSEIFDIRHG